MDRKRNARAQAGEIPRGLWKAMIASISEDQDRLEFEFRIVEGPAAGATITETIRHHEAWRKCHLASRLDVVLNILRTALYYRTLHNRNSRNQARIESIITAAIGRQRLDAASQLLLVPLIIDVGRDGRIKRFLPAAIEARRATA